MLPNASSPSALARRRAGSTVSTSTLPPWWAAAIAAAAAAVVVLPTPPDPQRDDDLLRREQLLERAGGASWRGAPSEPQLLAEPRRRSDWSRAGLRAREQVGHVEQRQVGGTRSRAASARCAAPVRRSVTASSAASSTSADVGSDRADEHASASGSRQQRRTSLPRRDRTARAALGSRRRRPGRRRSRCATCRASSIVSLTGISSGFVTMTTPVAQGRRGCRASTASGRGPSRPARALRSSAGAVSWPTMCPDASASTTTRS